METFLVMIPQTTDSGKRGHGFEDDGQHLGRGSVSVHRVAKTNDYEDDERYLTAGLGSVHRVSSLFRVSCLEDPEDDEQYHGRRSESEHIYPRTTDNEDY